MMTANAVFNEKSLGAVTGNGPQRRQRGILRIAFNSSFPIGNIEP